jgi:hypothetical protein
MLSIRERVSGVGGRGAICPSAHTGDVTAPRWARAAFGPRANDAACVRMLTFVGVMVERVLESLMHGAWAASGPKAEAGCVRVAACHPGLLTGVGFGY